MHTPSSSDLKHTHMHIHRQPTRGSHPQTTYRMHRRFGVRSLSHKFRFLPNIKPEPLHFQGIIQQLKVIHRSSTIGTSASSHLLDYIFLFRSLFGVSFRRYSQWILCIELRRKHHNTSHTKMAFQVNIYIESVNTLFEWILYWIVLFKIVKCFVLKYLKYKLR